MADPKGENGAASVTLGEIPGGDAGDQAAQAEKEADGDADFGGGHAVFPFEEQGQHGRDCAHAEAVQRDDSAEEGNAVVAAPASQGRTH